MALGSAFLDLGKVAGLGSSVTSSRTPTTRTPSHVSQRSASPAAPFFSDSLSEEIRAAIAAGVRAGDAEIDRKVAAIGTTAADDRVLEGAAT